MKKILTLLLCAALLPLLAGCDESDDVAEIFTGKTWKLTYIALDGQHQWFDFWNGDEAANQRSLQELEKGATFTVTFQGSDTEEVVGGEFNAQAINRQITGYWNADGSSRELRTTDIRATGSDSDVLARAFETGLRNATRYSGDSQNLYIYYEDGQTTNCMAFHIQ